MRMRYREEESSSAGTVALVLAGAIAGLAVGVLVAQRMGGLSGLRARLRRGGEEEAREGRGYDAEVADYDELEEEDEYGASEGGATSGFLEERVLEAFLNDPVLAERAVDIGSIGDGIIELAGWVNTEDEAHHAVTLARGVPGVDTVVNRLTVGEREETYEENARRVAEGDPALTEARWEGQGVGTGRRRQGTSTEMDRHADPRVGLEDRWQSEREALKHAADDMEGIAERRGKSSRKDHGGGQVAAQPAE
ncbi:MAG TPA: BON domain-containing protein [Gemmatimonadaceae bacterium]|nr:BON domain-containing protein [Gemmatimonadaceae bacterium]